MNKDILLALEESGVRLGYRGALRPAAVKTAKQRAEELVLRAEETSLVSEAEALLRAARKIRYHAARRAGRSAGLRRHPELWQWFGKDSCVMEDVVELIQELLPEAVGETHEIPESSVWELDGQVLRSYWLSVGCNPARAIELVPAWVAAARRLKDATTYASGWHVNDALSWVAGACKGARGQRDWALIARGFARSFGLIRSRRWLRRVAKMSDDLFASFWVEVRTKDPESNWWDIKIPSMGDLEFWKRVQARAKVVRRMPRMKGRIGAVRDLPAWLDAGLTPPRRLDIIQAGASIISVLAPVWETCWRSIRDMSRVLETVGDHDLLAVANAYHVYGDKAPGFLGKDPVQWHDRAVELRKDMLPVAAAWLWQRRAEPRDVVRRCVRVASSWKVLQEIAEKIQLKGGALEEKTLPELEAILVSVKYEGAQHLGFATEAATHGYPTYSYPATERRWLAGVEGVTRESVPHVDMTVNGYRLWRLDRDDPRGLFLGEHTDCCQHPQGAGSSCAWHGVENPDGAFVAIEKHGTIVAQSWVWRHADTLVFDNIELLADQYAAGVTAVFKKAVPSLLGKLSVKAIKIGLGMTDLDFVKKLPKCAPTPAPAGCYTDANSICLFASV